MLHQYPNPYDILEISAAASDKEIIQAFMLAMKKRKYTSEQIANARKILINQKERMMADILRPIIPTVRRFRNFNIKEYDIDKFTWEILPEFDGLDHKDNIEKIIAQAYREEFIDNE
jgi:hypothetical protein